MSFYCRSGTMREDIAHSSGFDGNRFLKWHGLPRSPFTHEYYRSQFSMERYCSLVTLYCSRSMSNSMDALSAVCGILNIWSESSNVKFIAGLLRTQMTDSLIWYGSKYLSRGHRGLPSWSWAAWQGVISYEAVITEITGEKLEWWQQGYKFDMAVFSGPLRSRLVSFSHPETINFGTLIEQEAVIRISKDLPAKPQRQ